MQKSKKRKLIIINAFLLLVLVCGIVFAWFAMQNQNSVNSDDVTIVADNAIQLSVDNTNWYSTVNLSQNLTGFSSVTYKDITGSGSGTFLRPDLQQYSDHADIASPNTWSSTPVEMTDYVGFTLYIRSATAMGVYLGKNSSVDPSVGMSKLTGSTAENLSTYSTDSFKFSKDIGVGAVRVSAVSGTNRLFTWIPRPEIYFPTTSTEYSNYSSIITNATSGESYTHKYYASTADTSTTTLSPAAITGTITESNTQLLSTLTQSESGYYEGSVKIYIWLEGCDTEARRAFVGGKFNVNLNITGQDIA